MILANVKHEARLTGSARSMQDWGWNNGESFELDTGQPLHLHALVSLLAVVIDGQKTNDAMTCISSALSPGADSIDGRK